MSRTSDFELGTIVTTLSAAKRYRVSARVGWPGASILPLGVMRSPRERRIGDRSTLVFPGRVV